METRSVDLADVGRSFDIRTRSFGVAPASSRPGWEERARAAIDDGRSVGVYDGRLLVGRAMIWPFRQWWGGRPLPMAGIAGVVVSLLLAGACVTDVRFRRIPNWLAATLAVLGIAYSAVSSFTAFAADDSPVQPPGHERLDACPFLLARLC